MNVIISGAKKECLTITLTAFAKQSTIGGCSSLFANPEFNLLPEQPQGSQLILFILLIDFTVEPSISKIDHYAYCHPYKQSHPGVPWQCCHNTQ